MNREKLETYTLAAWGLISALGKLAWHEITPARLTYEEPPQANITIIEGEKK